MLETKHFLCFHKNSYVPSLFTQILLNSKRLIYIGYSMLIFTVFKLTRNFTNKDSALFLNFLTKIQPNPMPNLSNLKTQEKPYSIIFLSTFYSLPINIRSNFLINCLEKLI